MKQFQHLLRAFVTDTGEVLTRPRVQVMAKVPRPGDVVCVLLPLCAIILWAASLKYVHLENMTDIGLISVLPYSILFALALLMVSFCLTLHQPQLRISVLLLHLILLIFMLYGTTILIEGTPDVGTVYREIGYAEYIMRTGSVAPKLDPYFSWPGFFVLNAIVTRTAGFHDALSYAVWAPVFLNLIYLAPLYIIFTSATTNKWHVWLGLWFFYLTNWIGQDYFLAQGLNYFLYLVILAILLKWFKRIPVVRSHRPGKFWHPRRNIFPLTWLHKWLASPDTLYTPIKPAKRIALLTLLVVIFAFIVFSHPLTAFNVTASVAILVIFRRCTPFWLPVLMAAMTIAWILIMAQPYLATNNVLGDFGKVNAVVTTNVTNRLVQGSPGHTVIAELRAYMTITLWVLALIGAICRLRAGYRDVTYILLAISPFSLFVSLSYGGEILQRIYLFTLPLMVFFAAAIFFTSSPHKTPPWRTPAIVCISLLLLVGFLFTRYGNEDLYYFPSSEIAGVRYLYSIAPPKSLLIEGWQNTPWRFQDEREFHYDTLDKIISSSNINIDVNEVLQLIKNENNPGTYLVFARSQIAEAVILEGMPPGWLNLLENALLKSGKFKLLYNNRDIQVLVYLS